MTLRRNTLLFFSSTLVNGALSFAVLPLTTRVLGASDYGRLGALAAIATAIGGFCATSVGYLFPSTYPTADFARRKELVSSALVAVAGLSVVGIAMMWAIVVALRAWTGGEHEFATAEILLAAMIIPGSAFWAVGSDIFTLSGRADRYAIVAIGQGVMQSAATLVCLFGLGFHGTALFIGVAAGNLLAILLSIYHLRDDIGANVVAGEIVRHLRTGAVFAAANLVELVYPALERWLLVGNRGLEAVGIYTHAQSYRALSNSAVKSMGRSIWPTSLAEARSGAMSFPETQRIWRLGQFLIVSVGIGFAAIGDIFLDLLTNGKFVAAHAVATALFAILVFQHSGKAEIAMLYAQQRVKALSVLAVVANLSAIATALTAIPVFGIWGAIAAVGMQTACYRVGVFMLGRRSGLRLPLELLVFASPAFIGGTLAIKLAYALDLRESLVLLLVSLAAWSLFARREAAQLLQQIVLLRGLVFR